jgi:hypothetical protein
MQGGSKSNSRKYQFYERGCQKLEESGFAVVECFRIGKLYTLENRKRINK